MTDRHHYLTAEVLPDGTIGDVEAHSELADGTVLPPPALSAEPLPALEHKPMRYGTDKGRTQLLEELLNEIA